MIFLFRKSSFGAGIQGWVSLLAASLSLLVLGTKVSLADGAKESAPTGAIDLASPSLMTGTLYEIGSDRKKVLFKFRRAATRSGTDIRVEQEFALPDGSLACRELILYRNNQLVSYVTEDLRAETKGSILVQRDPKKPKKERLLLENVQGKMPGGKIQKGVENLLPNTLICDTIYPFILAHWDELKQGTAVKFRFVSLDPPDTFSFRVVLESETTWEGKPVLRIKMEPTNFIIAHLIHPIYFLIEQAAPHRVFSYTGRTTPRGKVGEAWKFIEAEAVFDWK